MWTIHRLASTLSIPVLSIPLFPIPLLIGCLLAPCLLVASLPATAALPGAPAPDGGGGDDPGAAAHRHIERQGITVDLDIEPVDPEAGPLLREGDAVRVRFEIRDSHTGEPLTSAYPAAWMDRLPPFGIEQPVETCQDKVEAFIGGTLLAQPELDLNVYYVLAMNDDASISVVDPLFGFGNSKLLEMAFLDSPGYDWALTEDQRRLFVSMPQAGKIAVVDTASWEVVERIDVGRRPWRLALQPDGHYLWVAYRGPSPSELASGVAAVDAETLDVIAHLPTGRGLHDLAFDRDGRHLFVSNREDGTVSVIDISELRKLRDVPTAEDPVSLAYSEAGEAVYVSHLRSGVIAVIDGETLEVSARLQAEPGLEMIRFAPDRDRLGFVVNPAEDVLHVIDPATAEIVQTGDMEDGPDQVAFSDELVYVRHRGSGTVLMIPRQGLGGKGDPVPVVDFPGGQHPPGRMALPTPADGIMQAPGATAVLVANAGDQAIYYYKEGMAAPMGHFKNYSRQPRAVRVVDRSLQEIEPGVYETAVQLRRPGRYDLAFFLDSPRMVHCFPLRVAANPEIEDERRAKTRPYEVRYAAERTHFEVGEEVELRFEIRDSVSGEAQTGLEDVEVLTFLAPGVWQKRHEARALEGGGYQVLFEPPRKGVYYVFVSSPSLGFGVQSSPYLTLTAGLPQVGPGGRESDEAAEGTAGRNGEPPAD